MNFDPTQSLANQFLIAMPSLNDPGFEGTVTLICEHTAEGAVGMVINRPTDLTLGEVLNQLDMDPASDQIALRPVVAGGPVARDRGFVVHSLPGKFESTLEVSPSIRVSFSLDALSELARASEDANALFGLGYAGWEGGQLEQELLDNAWLTAPADPDLIYATPFEQRWQQAAASIGVDLSKMAPAAGHD